ncbi:dihydroneopterin aldolase [Streptococcus pyogenes]|uniref:7,8-dihydroneopterin aldolase n=1 Tax=Streptococcus pyogenes TaxID=1314 RepID=Q933R8_STRPY|nr:dihydroneopterin aldolase [Streptococcus pyogenes]ESU85387.1 dihydroneopterin aldolase [Streptococcus pyogenes GA03799]AIL10674.1 dihydroneopterin aldolase [Streptococcus pyogenes]ASO68443.1 dihydroneopterin aldolase [Streptococcus pyogenes]ASO74158.1 dihydroneopterin aldolase [Streptococcus pyogenes]KAB1894900.1 dihydroneopterin aldolase [Streptococcus pyogenes]
MDKIVLEGCRFYGYHGAYKEEQTLGQIFLVDLELSVDLQAASLSDQLTDTVHYGMVFDSVRQLVEGEKFILIERLAGAICEQLFNEFPPIEAIKVAIKKENPPIAGHYKAVGIELERQR